MTRLAALLGLELPLLQAGMGAVAGPALCAEVSRAGAGGTLALYKEPPARAARLVREVAAATSLPFGVNVVPEVVGPASCLDQLRAVLHELPQGSFVTSFGLPDPDAARAVQDAGHPLVIQIGTPEDADTALGQGAAALVLQGTEAGGHLLGRLPGHLLLAAVRARHPHAVLAVAGGIATGSDLADAVARGADGAMAGTLFVPAAESTAHPQFKRRVIEAVADDTLITSLFDIGWPQRRHRVLRNPLTAAADRAPATFIATSRVDGREHPVPRYSAAAPSGGTTGRIEEMAMYCGRSCSGVTAARTAAETVAQIRWEYENARRPPGACPGSAANAARTNTFQRLYPSQER
ncbi:nitronate monooxygenase [Streptomyces sp. NBC_01443]|uniref:NAD(P)H-dependent flavin oxidoreductase n=1 Tax=Streptomyces sp. NBC_01443 TaxID=2903868 RepID=UPI002251793D|nr:nitronate monooxygenase [Streptomyces sp. NBC_01443]MCX4632257.1 nitronate monooxygenase [Streptomyces sp. NBC_01443]